MIGHPREDVLLAFQDHRLDDQRRRRLAGHLSGCQRCRNVVQAHRTVRGVFALEAPFAPDGVLERALASRAAGMLVMLPVAEPGARRRMELPSRGFLVAMGVVLTVGVGVQLAPTAPLQRVWGAWSAVVVEWKPFANGGLNFDYPRPPVAKGAVIDPTRIRPMRARYRWNDLQDGTVRLIRPLTFALSREANGWRFEASMGNSYSSSALLDGSLQPVEWSMTSSWGSKNQHLSQRRYILGRDSIREIHQVTLAEGGVMPRYGREPYDSTWAFDRRVDAPYALQQGHLYLLLAATPLRRGWVGSFYDAPSPRYNHGLEGYPTTLVVVGKETLTTPAGTFHTWKLQDLAVGPIPYQRLWVNQADGLVVKQTYGDSWGVELVLESVTYP